VPKKADKWAVITGASGGIGRELAEACAQDSYNVLLTARDEKGLRDVARHLETTYKIKTLTLTADLSKSGQAEKLHQLARQRKLTVSVLVNNAGFGDFGAFEAADWTRLQAMIELNMTALTRLAQLFGADMVKRKQGRVLNVASTAAFLPGPYMAVYYASKAYVLSLSQALSEEWKRSGVTVTALCPGPTQTGFAAASRANKNPLFLGKLPSAKEVAAFGYKAMIKGKPVAIHGLRNRATIFSSRLMSRRLQTRLVARAQRNKQS
jgi:short-subunit dehydrogenase